MPATHLKTGWYFEFKNLDSVRSLLLSLNTAEHPLFHTSQWYDSVLCWLPPNSKPVFWIYVEHGQVIGIVPLLLKQTIIRKLAVSQLEWLRVPDSHFCEVIAAPCNLEKILTTFWKALAQSPFSWNTLQLYPISKSLGQALNVHCPLPHTLEQATEHPWINISDSWDDYYKTRSRRLKKGNNHLANRLQEKGQLHIQHVTHESTNFTQESIISQLKHISQGSWKSSTQTTFNHHGPAHFITTLTQHALKQQWLSLWFLYLDDQLLAYEYQLSHKKNVYALRADFNEHYRSLSPGSYLNWKILEALFNQGYQRYYMGPGENPYKARWNNESEPVFRFCAYSNTIKGRLLNSLNTHIIPMVRPLKSKLYPSKQKEPQV